ncbi:hypothetical protein AMTR_s00010p00037910 [Amborella trichopoda]|uniref:Uncharacterized protein n=1 Tax=Amborella trichopoda TaxID=13333 RepID=W1NFS4_AMBTC|nr:hypothetical protein AMTR_s00010p00037910 [Amborella trichopoda]
MDAIESSFACSFGEGKRGTQAIEVDSEGSFLRQEWGPPASSSSSPSAVFRSCGLGLAGCRFPFPGTHIPALIKSQAWVLLDLAQSQ